MVQRASAEPVVTLWPSPGAVAGQARVVAAAGLGGLWATSDGQTIEVRDIRQSLRLTKTVTDFSPLIGSFDPALASVSRMTFSESGRLLFVTLHYATPADASLSRREYIVRIDTDTGTMTLFDAFGVTRETTPPPPMQVLHAGGRLNVGFDGEVMVRRAQRNDTGGSALSTVSTQPDAYVVALAFDRVGKYVFAVDANGVLFRMNAGGGSASPLGNVGTGVCSAAFSEHFGGTNNAGLYLGFNDGHIRFVSAAAARGSPPVIASDYTAGQGPQMLAAAADGSLLVGNGTGAWRLSESSDPRLSFEAWLEDEVRQQVTFAKGLVSPQGEPAGWVIDGDVAVGGTLFHPATPDAAAWAVLLLTTADELFHDPQARPLVRTILRRYAGQLPGPVPSRNPDGIFRHWIDPQTGGSKSGWDPEFATMSTMKLVDAAARAANHFSDDAEIAGAARAICCTIHNWDAYVRPGDRAMFLKGDAGGGPAASSASQPFHEGLLFMEQAAFYGSSPATASAYASWLDRSSVPGASYLTNRKIASTFTGYAPAFISIYPLLLVDDFRSRSDWRDQIANISSSAAAWTDDNLPRWFTVFSAGTTKPEWGGYHADAINDSPGNVAAFTALCGLAARADGLGVREATAAYHAYRTGARQSFRSGASMLFRRSNADPAWSPGDAGMPDVAMGGLGLAEVLSEGFTDRVLASALLPCGACRADIGRAGGIAGSDGALDNNDFIVFINAFFANERVIADFGGAGGIAGGDGLLDNNDFIAFINAFFGGC